MKNWDDIVAQHGPLVWTTALRLLGCDADAADCYQEVFVAALSISTREEVKNWPGLLHKLATVHALNRLRRRMKDGVRQGPPGDLNLVASGIADPSQSAQENELIEWLRGALAALPESQAQAFSLVCIGELSYREAAMQMNVDQNNVAVLVHRVRPVARTPHAEKGN